MLTIRDDQINVFARMMRANFIQQMVSFLKEKFPESAVDVDVQWVEEEVHAAEHFGLRGANDLQDYLCLGMVHGRNFIGRPEHRWMEKYLTDATVPDAHDRMRRLYSAVIARLRAAEASATARANFELAYPSGEEPS